ncbi:tetraspanin-14 isoform X2 [Hirundo rustica]|uniref:tetraspanin-14 isoform X2 n=1 Tax=Hirundo rustica TaxID=43150 RepID=UPI00267125B6|nr:tetraspanin-14 isoform X2 [Hirundo rustica]
MHYYRYSNAEVSCWYKYLLFSYNIVFWGVLSDLTKVTGLHGLDPVVLVLVVGIVMFTLGFAGCVGALRENICLLKFFCGTIVFIFLLELAVAVMAFLFQDWVRDRVKEFFENNIKSYRDDIDLQNIIDSLQRINHCCGAQGPEDWDFNIYFDCKSESKSREKCGVPFSCCIPDPAQKVVNTQCGYDIRKKSKSQWDDQIFVKGCIHALEAWLPRNIYIVAGVFIAISLLQIFGIFLARTLISDIEAVKIVGDPAIQTSPKKQRRWKHSGYDPSDTASSFLNCKGFVSQSTSEMRLRAFEELAQKCFWEPVSPPAACTGQDGFIDFGAVYFWFDRVRVAEFLLGSGQQ